MEGEGKAGWGEDNGRREEEEREAEAAYPSHETSVIIHNAGDLRLVPQGSP